MKTFLDTVHSLWRVLVVALVFGAALPAVFAVGIRCLSVETVDEHGTVQRRPDSSITLGRILGLICMAAVLVAIVAGILFLMHDFLADRFGLQLF